MKKLLKQWLIVIIGLYFSAFGTVFSVKAELGITPISSIPYLYNQKFPVLSFGQWTILMNILFIVTQLLLLRRNFAKQNWWQIPLILVFGFFLDLNEIILANLPTPNYSVRLCYTFVGILIMAFGITLTYLADLIQNSGEMLVSTIAQITKKDFGKMKIIFDVSCVLFTTVSSLIFFHKVIGIREGTLLIAVLTGLFVNVNRKFLSKPIKKFISH